VLRLKLTARDPWLSRIELFFFVLFIGLHVALGEVPARGGVVVLFFLMGLYAVVNLLWVPAVVTGRVTKEIAAAVKGSVLSGAQWVVPS
jgi:hypothetical protein